VELVKATASRLRHDAPVPSTARQNYFGEGEDYGVRMYYAVEETPLGTAGSVANAREHSRTRSSSSPATPSQTSTSALIASTARRARSPPSRSSTSRTARVRVVVTGRRASSASSRSRPGERSSPTPSTRHLRAEPEVLERVRSTAVRLLPGPLPGAPRRGKPCTASRWRTTGATSAIRAVRHAQQTSWTV